MFLQTSNHHQSIPDELILRLINEELRGRKLFHKLSSLGITENFYYPSFSWLVLNTLGINAEDDVICDRYFKILDEHVGKIKESRNGNFEQAKEVLSKLRRLK